MALTITVGQRDRAKVGIGGGGGGGLWRFKKQALTNLGVSRKLLFSRHVYT